jgi:hypothetical protein
MKLLISLLNAACVCAKGTFSANFSCGCVFNFIDPIFCQIARALVPLHRVSSLTSFARKTFSSLISRERIRDSFRGLTLPTVEHVEPGLKICKLLEYQRFNRLSKANLFFIVKLCKKNKDLFLFKFCKTNIQHYIYRTSVYYATFVHT